MKIKYLIELKTILIDLEKERFINSECIIHDN